jgi:D-amino peptidase
MNTLYRIAVILLIALPIASAPPRLRVYISADMEGIGGVVTDQQLGPTGFEYTKFRELMTEEVLAAIAGAREAGATDILVSDSHGNFQNLLVDRFPKDVSIVRGGPRPLSMMQGIDETFDAVVFIGYHSSTTNPSGVRAHTISSARLADVRINGVSMPEAGLNAALAGQFRVPVVMISGDEAAVAEARKIIGDIEGAVVKESYGFHSAKIMTPEASRERIRETVRRALQNRERFRPLRVQTPVTLEVRFKNYRPAEVASWLPNVERADAHSIRFVGKDMAEVVRFLSFVTNYDPALEP